MQNLETCFVGFLLLVCSGGVADSSMEFAQPNRTIPYFPQVPLWIDVKPAYEDDFSEHCHEIYLDGNHVDVSCTNSFLVDYEVSPGEHSLELVPTYLPSTRRKSFVYVSQRSQRFSLQNRC